MKKTHWENLILLIICTLGTLITLSNVLLFGLRYLGTPSNFVSDYILQNTAVDVGYMNKLVRKYTYSDSIINKYQYWINKTEDVVINFCTTSFPNNAKIHNISESIKTDVLGDKIDSIPYVQSNDDVITEDIDAIVTFYNSLCQQPAYSGKDKSLPKMICVLVPTSNHEQVISDCNTFCNKVNSLNNTDITVIYLRDYPEIELQYDASGHWLNTCALEATDIIISNAIHRDDYFNYSDVAFYNYMDEFEDVKKDIQEKYNYNYEIPVPFPTQSPIYKVYINETEELTGTFSDVFIKDSNQINEIKNENKAYSYHNLWRMSNATLYDIENLSLPSHGSDILVLGDSFSWPTVAYLSLSTSHMVYMNPSVFSHCAYSYIQEQFHPDTIIILFNDLNLYNHDQFCGLN